ncbi:hypothetical protein PINS_up021529 [Pythium insidiosum]|nr:hypothetical protein PINS_up021529 [Pythium insidiosum]
MVSVVFAVFVAYIAMDEVLHLDAFTGQNVVLRDDFAVPAHPRRGRLPHRVRHPGERAVPGAAARRGRL